jgi:predicted AAA+ superfamily ATPase
MKRLVFYDLLDWRYSSTRMPILLRGARQVGKTHLVRQLGEKFDQLVEVNFEKKPDLAKIFEYDLDPVRITRELSLALEGNIVPGKTLLFFDEVQAAPKSILALRYFYEEMPALHVIAAGSLVDFAIDKVGVPVGRVSFLYLYPLSFVEYLYARGFQKLAIEMIKHNPSEAMPEVIHTKALRLLGEYTAIGGMPKAIDQWINTQDIQLCSNTLQSIKNAYEQDFSKYAKKHEIKYVELLFRQIPGLICQPFKYSNLATDYRKRELEPSLHLLEKAGILHQVMYSAGNGLPLGAETEFSKFKLVMFDIGLCQTILGLERKDWFIDPGLAFINKGKITENFVGQELLAYANPANKQNLYYWRRELRGSNAEIDYLITSHHNIIPIEVKSGHGAGLQSMRAFLQSHPSSPHGIRFSTHNYSIFDGIHSYPLYAIAGAVDNKEGLLRYLENAEK